MQRRGLDDATMTQPSISEWLALSEQERVRHVAALKPYAGEGSELLEVVVDLFRKEFGHLRGLKINGPGVYHGGSWVIGASHPLVFDKRLLPPTFLGIQVHKTTAHPLPVEFQNQERPRGYVWSPNNFSRFVDRCGDEVRRELENPNMTREDMLHALIGEPYEEFVTRCRGWVAEGRIPPFEGCGTGMEPRITVGDLLDQDVEVIVNSWNRNIIPWWLLLPQGVSGAIKRRAGYAPFWELGRLGPIPLGGAVVTGAGRLPHQGIIHVAGISMLWRSSERAIRGCVRSALDIARERGFRSIAFPLIGAGTGGFSPERALNIMQEEMQQSNYEGEVRIVRFRRE